MRRIVVLAALMLATAAPASAWEGTTAYNVPGDGVADCLRPAGSGHVTLSGEFGHTTFSTAQLLGVRAASITPAQSMMFGELATCPATADGSSPLLVGAVRLPGAGSQPNALRVASAGRRAQLLRVTHDGWAILNVVTAQAPRGAAVVAWTEATRRFHNMRVLASVRPPGRARFEAPVVLVHNPLVNVRPTAGIDAAGQATVAWADSSGDRAFDAIRMAASTPSGHFGAPQRVSGATWRGFDDARVAVEVTPGGRLLLAAETLHGLHAWERTSSAGRLVPVPIPRPRRDDVRGLDVALNPDGGAVIVYDAGRGPVMVTRRRPTGAFLPWEEVVPVGRSHRQLGLFWGLSFASARDARVIDWQGGELRAALAKNGEIVVGWVDPVHGALASAALATYGTLAGGMQRPQQLGSPCRPAAVSTPVRLPDGRLAVAWSDNARADSFFDSTLARGGGRVHLALPRPPVGERPSMSPPPAPRLSAQLTDSRPLGTGEPLHVRVHCDGPCDVRAVATSVVPRQDGTQRFFRLSLATSATLPAGGTTELSLKPEAGVNAAGARGVPQVPISLVACIPGGAVADGLELAPPPIAAS